VAAELIAVLVGAIRFLAALDAATAVAGAQVPEGRGRALSIFVAFVANVASLVAAVGVGRTAAVTGARPQTVVGQ